MRGGNSSVSPPFFCKVGLYDVGKGHVRVERSKSAED